MVNNIGPSWDNFHGALPSKSVPPVPVSSTSVNPKTAGGPGVLPNDKPDGFVPSSNTLDRTSDSLGSHWSNLGAAPAPAPVEETNEIRISSFRNTKGPVSDLTFKAIPNNPQVQGVLVAAANTWGADASRIAGITVS
jgi:hypothetical protein